MIYKLHEGCLSAEIQCVDCMVRMEVENPPEQVRMMTSWWPLTRRRVKRWLRRAMLEELARKGCPHAKADLAALD
jgi:hypothetical protein